MGRLIWILLTLVVFSDVDRTMCVTQFIRVGHQTRKHPLMSRQERSGRETCRLNPMMSLVERYEIGYKIGFGGISRYGPTRNAFFTQTLNGPILYTDGSFVDVAGSVSQSIGYVSYLQIS